MHASFRGALVLLVLAGVSFSIETSSLGRALPEAFSLDPGRAFARRGSSLRIALLGDGQGTSNSRALLEAISRQGVDLLILVGDAVRSPRLGYHRLLSLEVEADLGSTPVWFLPGNRDLAPGRFDAEDFRARYGSLRRVATMGSTYLVGLATVDGSRGVSKELDRLEALLEARPPGIERTLVFTHYPPKVSDQLQGRHLAAKEGERLLEICHRFGVELLGAGHFHGSQRFRERGLEVLISGAGGAGFHTPNLGATPHAALLEWEEGSFRETWITVSPRWDRSVLLLGNLLEFGQELGALCLFFSLLLFGKGVRTLSVENARSQGVG